MVASVAVGAVVLRHGASGSTPAGCDWSTYIPPPVATDDLAELTKNAKCEPPESDRVPLTALDDFEPVATFACVEGQNHTYPDGRWAAWIREATTDGVADAVAAMNAPPSPAPSALLCPLVLVGEPEVSFVDREGKVLVPEFRRDGCNFPIGEGAIPTIARPLPIDTPDTVVQIGIEKNRRLGSR